MLFRSPLCISIICESGIGLPGRDSGGRPVTSDLPRTCGGDVMQYVYIPPRLLQIPTETPGDCGGLRRGQRDRRSMLKQEHDVEHMKGVRPSTSLVERRGRSEKAEESRRRLKKVGEGELLLWAPMRTFGQKLGNIEKQKQC